MSTDSPPGSSAGHRAQVGEHLCFRLSGGAFAVPIAQVQEVLALPKTTAVPAAPPFITGVFPLRGVIVPLVDLTNRLRLGAVKGGREACALVVRAQRASGELLIALQIDEILDVAEFSAAALAPAPDMGARVSSELLLGLHRAVDDSLTFILDLERILSPSELEEAAGVTSG